MWYGLNLISANKQKLNVQTIDLDENVRVPMSAVNALRRRCLESLEAVRQKPKRIDVLPWEPGLHRGGFDGAQIGRAHV